MISKSRVCARARARAHTHTHTHTYLQAYLTTLLQLFINYIFTDSRKTGTKM